VDIGKSNSIWTFSERKKKTNQGIRGGTRSFGEESTLLFFRKGRFGKVGRKGGKRNLKRGGNKTPNPAVRLGIEPRQRKWRTGYREKKKGT